MSKRHDPSRGSTPQQNRQYEVGYGKPPRATRFQPGRSGNPKGRPKNSGSLNPSIRQALTEKLVVREGARTRTITKVDGVVMRQLDNALKGDSRSALAVLKIAAQIGLLNEPAADAEALHLTHTEQQIVDEALKRSVRKRSRQISKTTGTGPAEGGKPQQ